MATIASTAALIIQAAEQGKDIYNIVVNSMDALETISANKSGADKKSIVLAVVQGFVEQAGENWSTWVDDVSKFIDTIKAIYNGSVSFFNSIKSNTATASV